MEIKFEDKFPMSFGDLKNGATFLFRGTLCAKMVVLSEPGRTGYSVCVDLVHNEVDQMEDDKIVVPVNAHIVQERDLQPVRSEEL